MMGARELLPVFFSYCRRMLRAFLLVALGGATLFVVTILYRAPLELPLYTCCLVGAVGAVFFFSGFARYYRRHAALRMLRAQCATKLAALPAPRDILEKDYGDIIAALERNRLSAAADAAHREADATEYYTLWSHQIKTPLAAMRLLLQESRISLAAAPLPRSCSRPNSMWTWCWAICALVLSMPISRRRRSLWRPLCGRA